MTQVESLGYRRRAASAALDDLRSAIREAAKYFEADEVSYYLPSEDDVIQRWEDELSSFELIPIAGEDAIAALRREADRIPPARATPDGSAVGSRDAAIWLSVRRFHLSGGAEQVTYFVSSNSTDFGAKSNKRLLRSELLEELRDARDRFFYFPNLSSLVESFADKLATLDISREYLRSLQENLQIDSLIAASARRMIPSSSECETVGDRIALVDAQEKSAFGVDGNRLSLLLVEFDFFILLRNENGYLTSKYGGQARIWLYDANGVATVELDQLRPMTHVETVVLDSVLDALGGDGSSGSVEGVGPQALGD
ncbi:hypothetical protein GCM10009779_65060 [Polymorphospora rubra]|uniref:DUF4935 domain-containing protein n=2 Tax=Polymorphospora rubra TaxID=338584 RepID=A0A810N1S3_9ACTN|nr:hypothetical protein Prubr_45920 [Polymorphospora rubra]